MKSRPTTKRVSSALADTLRLIPGYDPFATAGDSWLDVDAVETVFAFFSECLKHVEGAVAGQPFKLEPWQQAIVGNIFGWKRKDDKGRIVRRYREAFIFVPRKNGKSPLVAGICNYVLFCDREPGAQIYSAAADKDQAAIIYRHASGMIAREPELEKRARIYRATKTIQLNEDQASVYKVLSADADNKHGGNSHLVMVDELHAQPNRELVDVLETSMASENRPQPLMIHITTSDFDRPSICNEKHEYASKVRDGVIDDPRFLPVIYEAAQTDDWKDPKVWAKANPNLGISVSLEYMRAKCKQAQDVPSFENTFRRLHLNQKTKTDRKWLDLAQWDNCGGAVSEELLRGRTCYGGLDLSTKFDLTAWVLVFPPNDEDELYRVLPRFFVPADNAREREKRDRVPYLTWERQKLVTATEGNVIDYAFIEAQILKDCGMFDVRQVAYDPWNATQTAIHLQDENVKMIEFRQGYRSMSEPAKELERLVISGKLAHGGNPVLRWMASNTMIESDPAGNIKASKAKSTEKIDGIVASIMALGLAMQRPPDDVGASIYERRGMLVI
ncbi:MAG: terminase large subunit [Phycisphaerae bacterium]|nr:terminase large subunit [Phycisphaerae bacterium]